MIGGIVIKIDEGAEKRTVVVQGVRGERFSTCRVFTELGADVEVSDEVWWQGKEIFVTRGSRFEKVFYDKPIPKIGYSGKYIGKV